MKMHFPSLETNRLSLEKITREYAEELIEIAAFKAPKADKKDALDLIDKLNESYENGNGITWGIFLGTALIGTVGFYRGFENQVGEIGYVMREAFKRKGYMEEAMIAALRYGFDDLNLKTIEAFTKAENTPSVLLLEKLGFENTGRTYEVYTIFEYNRIF